LLFNRDPDKDHRSTRGEALRHKLKSIVWLNHSEPNVISPIRSIEITGTHKETGSAGKNVSEIPPVSDAIGNLDPEIERASWEMCLITGSAECPDKQGHSPEVALTLGFDVDVVVECH
jgi:hypothetical protein